jgi:hypothetical protein
MTCTSPTRNIPFALRRLVSELETQLGPCQRILEIGCGPDSALQYVTGEREIEGLDVHEPWLLKAKERGILSNYHLANALEIDTLFQPGQFDAIVALDLIEHLEKPDGYELIKKMSTVASDRIIIFTPNGFLPQQDESNPWNNHLSGWSVNDFAEQGFSVVGVNGWKQLRGSWAKLRFRPRLFWGAISELSQMLLTHNHPKLAFSLLCTKLINKRSV